MLTQEELVKNFTYSPETGEFKRLGKGGKLGWTTNSKYPARMIQIGQRAYVLNKIVWLYMTGVYPDTRVFHLNGDIEDLSWNNLHLPLQAHTTQPEELTQDVIKEVLTYQPETGKFYWKFKFSPRVELGKEVGCLNSLGYVCIGFGGEVYLAHRLAWLYMTGTWPEAQIDHINHNRADNRWENIRSVSIQHNRKNMMLLDRNTSGALGVCWDNSRNKWLASIGVNGKHKHLGRFENKEDAILVRKMAEQKYEFHPNHGKR